MVAAQRYHTMDAAIAALGNMLTSLFGVDEDGTTSDGEDEPAIVTHLNAAAGAAATSSARCMRCMCCTRLGNMR